MSLGPSNPTWIALRERLVELTREANGHNAYVLDAWAPDGSGSSGAEGFGVA
jgi:hypothetical protein